MDDTPSPDMNGELVLLAERLNETLRLSGAASAEQAFGLGFSLGLGPTLVVLLLLFLFKVINIILAFILLVMALLAIVGITMLASQQARTNGIRRAYQTNVQAEISRFLAQHHLTRSQFNRLISPLLPEAAPLQAFLIEKEDE
jgi:hypothetical protein